MVLNLYDDLVEVEDVMLRVITIDEKEISMSPISMEQGGYGGRHICIIRPQVQIAASPEKAHPQYAHPHEPAMRVGSSFFNGDFFFTLLVTYGVEKLLAI